MLLNVGTFVLKNVMLVTLLTRKESVPEPAGALGSVPCHRPGRMAAAAGFTVMVAVPVLPSVVADTTAEPAAAAETRPALETVATPELDVVHVNDFPATVPPLAFFATALNWTLWGGVRVELVGVTSTDVTAVAEGPVGPLLELSPVLLLPPLQAAATARIPSRIARKM